MGDEPRIPGLRRVARNFGRRIDRDVDDEIAFHLESRVRDLMVAGQTEEDARQTAELEFGDLTASRRELADVDRRRRRRERTSSWIDAAMQELRHAVRSLRRSPGFSIAAIVTLALGIGATVAIFAVVNGVLLRPLPFGNPERLVGAWHDMPPLGMTHIEQSASTYFVNQRFARTIDGIGLYREAEVNVAKPGGTAEPERMTSAKISATLLPVLQVAPIVGHAFTDEEDRPGAAPVMLIDESTWRARFGADPNIVGRALSLNGVSTQIVGVMSARFRFPTPATRVWTPLALDPVNPPPIAFGYTGIARLKAGVSVADATRDFAAVLPRLPELFPNFVPGITSQMMMDQMRPRPVLVPLRDDITGGIARTLWMIAAAALLVLLVACANVANLTLVRADARQRELAVREALGAGRGRILLHFFTESAALSAIAATLALGGATIAVRGLVRAAPAGIPRLEEVGIDATALIFTLAVTVIAAFGCSVIPALRLGRGALALREGGRSGTAGRVQHRLRGGLVAAQIALALVVLAGSGLLLRTFERLHDVRPGFDANHVATFWVSLPPGRYKSDTATVRFYSGLVDRVSALPGVTAAGITSRLPLETHGLNPNPIYPEGDRSFESKLPPLQFLTAVNGGYFRAMGIPLIAGKLFDPMESQAAGTAIISRSTAQFFWKDSTGAAAIGKRFRPLPADPWYTVIGVVGDTRDSSLAAPPSQVVYFPETLEGNGGLRRGKQTMALVLRTAGAAASLAPAVQRAVRELDPSLPVFDARPMTSVVAAATSQLTLIIFILGGAAVVTLLLGAIGLYGVLAYVVTLRTRELGIRIALGATPRGVAAAMTRYGLVLTGIGIACGLSLFAIVARFLRALLFGVAADDPMTLGTSVLVLLAIAVAAAWVPARRAGRIDPADALRAE